MLTNRKLILKNTQSRPSLSPDKKKNERSVVKFPVIDFELRKKEQPEPIKEEEPKKKPKPTMIDAWTQTERSDYSVIKSRLI